MPPRLTADQYIESLTKRAETASDDRGVSARGGWARRAAVRRAFSRCCCRRDGRCRRCYRGLTALAPRPWLPTFPPRLVEEGVRGEVCSPLWDAEAPAFRHGVSAAPHTL